MRVGCEVLSVGDYDQINTVEEFAKYLHEYKALNKPCEITYRIADLDTSSRRNPTSGTSHNQSSSGATTNFKVNPPPYTPGGGGVNGKTSSGVHKKRMNSTGTETSHLSHRSALQRSIFSPDRSYSRSDGAQREASYSKFSKVSRGDYLIV